MLTNRQLYRAFEACKKIYGSDEIHVQLVAVQLNVLANEIIKYIKDNPTLVETHVLIDASGINYAGVVIRKVQKLPYISTDTILNEGDVDPTIELDFNDAVFNGSDDVEEWQVDVGTTELTFDSVSGTDLTFTGTAKAGTIEIKPLSEFVTDGLDVDVFYLTIEAKEYDYVQVKAGLSE